jgi:hypothetical protein
MRSAFRHPVQASADKAPSGDRYDHGAPIPYVPENIHHNVSLRQPDPRPHKSRYRRRRPLCGDIHGHEALEMIVDRLADLVRGLARSLQDLRHAHQHLIHAFAQYVPPQLGQISGAAAGDILHSSLQRFHRPNGHIDPGELHVMQAAAVVGGRDQQRLRPLGGKIGVLLLNLFRDIFPAARCVLLICFLSTTNTPQLAAGIFYY